MGRLLLLPEPLISDELPGGGAPASASGKAKTILQFLSLLLCLVTDLDWPWDGRHPRVVAVLAVAGAGLFGAGSNPDQRVQLKSGSTSVERRCLWHSCRRPDARSKRGCQASSRSTRVMSVRKWFRRRGRLYGPWGPDRRIKAAHVHAGIAAAGHGGGLDQALERDALFAGAADAVGGRFHINRSRHRLSQVTTPQLRDRAAIAGSGKGRLCRIRSKNQRSIGLYSPGP